MHEPGFVSVDITTKPGLDNWRGATSLGFRDAALNARNAFAPVKGDEQHERYGFTLNGPLWKQHTSLVALGRRHRRVRHQDDRRGAAVGLLRRFDPQAERRAERHRAARARAHEVADAARRAAAQPHDRPTISASATSTSLERGYSQDAHRDTCSARRRRARSARRSTTSCGCSGAATTSPIRADQHGAGRARAERVRRRRRAARRRARHEHVFTLADDLDIAIGRHAIRTGLQLDAGRYRTDELRNTGGTFTFASLDDYAAARPTTFTRNIGDPGWSTSRRRSSGSTCRTTSACART